MSTNLYIRKPEPVEIVPFEWGVEDGVVEILDKKGNHKPIIRRSLYPQGYPPYIEENKSQEIKRGKYVPVLLNYGDWGDSCHFILPGDYVMRYHPKGRQAIPEKEFQRYMPYQP